MLKRLFKFSQLILTALIIQAPGVHADAIPSLEFSDQDRILVLAPHPDDEVLGAGGVIQKAKSLGLPVKVAFFTHGDSNQWSFILYRKHPVFMPAAVQQMGLVRRDEAVKASSILGLDSKELTFLGYPDFGTLSIWLSHWGERKALRSLMTRVSAVPYQGAYRFGAPYKGEEIVADLRALLREFKPTKIFVSHPADHNGDHLALYLYLRVALWDEGMSNSVALYPYLIHYIGWPIPKGLVPNKDLLPPDALKNNVTWTQYHLSDEELVAKKKALLAHKTQYASSPKYLLSFVRNNELFGDFRRMQLHVNQDAEVFSNKHRFMPLIELPEEFNNQEKMAFIGVEWKFVRWQGDDLIISIQLSKPLANSVEAFVYIFGYNPTTPFAKMPKIGVKLGARSYSVYDQKKRIAQSSIKIKRTASDVTLVVPLKFLGNPDRILTSAHTYLGSVPLDTSSWVAVELY